MKLFILLSNNCHFFEKCEVLASAVTFLGIKFSLNTMVSAVWGFSVLRTVIFNKIAGVVEKVDKKCRERNQRNLIT